LLLHSTYRTPSPYRQLATYAVKCPPVRCHLTCVCCVLPSPSTAESGSFALQYMFFHLFVLGARSPRLTQHYLFAFTGTGNSVGHACASFYGLRERVSVDSLRLEHDAASVSNRIPTFRRNVLLVPIDPSR
jgi:hypothetical protein